MKYKSVKVDKRIYEQLKDLCSKEKRTISGQLEYILERYLKEKNKKYNAR